MTVRTKILMTSIVVLSSVSLFLATVEILMLYRVSLDQRRTDLVHTVRSQARLMEAVTKLDLATNDNDPAKATPITLQQFVEAHARFEGIRETGEFTLAKRQGDQIVFLLRHRHSDRSKPQPVPWASDLAEPMRRALSGESGAMVGADYRGKTVVAAHEPVEGLNWGVVAKMDLAEVRRPFVRAGLVAASATILIVLAGAIILVRVSSPLIDQMELARERAEEADRVKSAFLATMSHELRTPLNSIIGFTGVLMKGLPGPLNEEQAKQLGMVQGSARHLLRLINDVLDISKIEAGQFEIVSERFDLSKTIDQAVAAFTLAAEQKNLSLRKQVSPEVGEAVGDQRRVEQILLNLVSNAIKFTDTGEVRVTSERRNGTVVIRVSDTGCGIKPDDMDKLFRPFQQLDSGIARKRGGTGLGLAICKRLVDRMGGDISVESTSSEGSTFRFTLPVRPTADTVPEPARQ
jgi:signal transduction histidine kinase